MEVPFAIAGIALIVGGMIWYGYNRAKSESTGSRGTGKGRERY